jgi:2-aminoadipate transaminase
VISFARGVPAPECLPVAELADCARAVLEADGEIALNYGPVGGYGPLREWLAEQHRVSTDQIVLTNGSLQALDLVVSHFAAERRMIVEAPTYDRALRIAERHGVEVRDIPQDAEGLDPDALEAELLRDRAPAFLYLLPTFQNPSGRTLPRDRRRRVLELAEQHDLVVLEDDPYRRVRFEGEDVPSLRDESPGILHSSSFSKIMAPGLRVGYLVVPPQLARELEAAAVSTYLAPTFPTQAIAFEFLRRGRLESNLARVRSLLRTRRDALLSALEQHLPGASWTRPDGGYFVWLELPEGVGARAALSAGQETGVTFVPGGDFFRREADGASSARLAFSFPSPEEIDEGVELLSRACAAATRATTV